MTELYDFIQLGIVGASVVAAPLCVYIHGRMKYGSNEDRVNLESEKQQTLREIAETQAEAEEGKVRLQTDAYTKETQADIIAREAWIRALTTPEVKAYLERRKVLADELLRKEGFMGRKLYAEPTRLGATLNAILGESPFG